MIVLAVASLLSAQASSSSTVSADDTRLAACIKQAKTDPPDAISTASSWLVDARGSQNSYPQQCLGFAYLYQQKWDASRHAFTAARDALPAKDFAGRARLGAMAGNAALGAAEWLNALPLLDTAQADAKEAGEMSLAGSIAADRARALVGIGRNDAAAEALTKARSWDPRSGQVWLLSATLARRMKQMAKARQFIKTASGLAPKDPDIKLEAGLIAALSGSNPEAKAAWEAVILLAPGTRDANSAKAYLKELALAPPSGKQSGAK